MRYAHERERGFADVEGILEILENVRNELGKVSFSSCRHKMRIDLFQKKLENVEVVLVGRSGENFRRDRLIVVVLSQKQNEFSDTLLHVRLVTQLSRIRSFVCIVRCTSGHGLSSSSSGGGTFRGSDRGSSSRRGG